MTKSSLAKRVSSLQFADCRPAARDSSALSRPHQLSVAYGGRKDAGERTGTVGSPGSIGEVVSHPTVEISPPNDVTRRSLTGHGMTAESVDYTGQDTVMFRFRAPQHLLVAYEQGERTSGETFVEGTPSSRLRNLARRLTFVPAGHEYREQCESRTDTRITFFYFDPTLLRAASDRTAGEISLEPRLLFEDLPLWHSAMRLKGLLDDGSSADGRNFEAFSVVVAHELVRSGREASIVRSPLRGGLAGWQQRTVTAYIEEHFAERIPLATLAKLVRLSPWHFWRSFKQSFGMPPRRYQRERRIEHAKRLLASRKMSATEVGLQVGFGSFSTFATAFRRATGSTPRAYGRSL
jgi:AraC family transcriptional regulator